MSTPTIQPHELTTNRKALSVNLDNSIYGTFAEIGAGQETARHFFKAGGAAGTIAKSMSAYDMTYSDTIYGKSQRYVSHERLEQMLEHEYRLLSERLGEDRGGDSRFFVYANTVATHSYSYKGEAHGWMGLRYQSEPGGPPNDIICHVRMRDGNAASQQNALGIAGVNLIFAAHFYLDDRALFIQSLADFVTTGRIEVDVLKFEGPDFQNVDNRLVALELVEHGMTNAALFGPGEGVLHVSNALYKKPVLVERGSFRPVTQVNCDMLESARERFAETSEIDPGNIVVLFEVTMNNLLKGGELDKSDFLARVDTLISLGHHVLISNYSEYYRLSAYFRRYTDKPIVLVLGPNNLLEIFNRRYYNHLEGGILEGCGRLFKEDVRLFIYPMTGKRFNDYLHNRGLPTAETAHIEDFPDDGLVDAESLRVPHDLRLLYRYLRENGDILPVRDFNEERLSINAGNLLHKIRRGEPGWEEHVPGPAARIIKERGLWSHPGHPAQA